MFLIMFLGYSDVESHLSRISWRLGAEGLYEINLLWVQYH